MTLRSVAGSLAVFLAPCLALIAVSGRAPAGECTHCPKTVFCRPRPPCIKYKCVCPKPVCNPCDIEHFGYFPTCWQSWPYPPDFSHCPTPQRGMMLPPSMMPPSGQPFGSPGPSEMLPGPNETPAKVSLQ
jgi:hypothetical protein